MESRKAEEGPEFERIGATMRDKALVLSSLLSPLPPPVRRSPTKDATIPQTVYRPPAVRELAFTEHVKMHALLEGLDAVSRARGLKT